MIQKSSVAEDVSSLILLLRGLQKSELLLGLAWAVGGKLFLDLLEPFDEDFHRRFRRPGLRNRADLSDHVKIIGIGMGQIQRQLRTARPDQLVQDAGSQDNGLQAAADS